MMDAINSIPTPMAERSILDWAVPVTDRLNSLADKRGAAARNERDRALPKLRPWEIHFFPAATQEDEDFWGVYLPEWSLSVDGEEVTPTDESGTALVAAGAAYPGYYVIPVASETSPSAFWLHVYTSEGTGGTSYRATVTASGTANAGSGEETLTSIRLCSIASSGATTQLIVGAIALGGGGDSKDGKCIRPWDIRYFDDEECWGVYLPSLDVDYGDHCAELNVSGTEVVPKDYEGRNLSAVDADEHPGYFIVPLGNDGEEGEEEGEEEEGEEEGEVAAPTAFWLHVFKYKLDPEWAEYAADPEWADLFPYVDGEIVAIITAADNSNGPYDVFGTWELLTSIRICDVDDGNNVIQYVAGAIALTEGGGSSPASLPKGNFEPSWYGQADNVELSVSGGFFPFGRDFDWLVPSVDDTSYSGSGNGNEGMITAETATSGYFYLEVVHDSPSLSSTVYAVDDSQNSNFSKFCDLVRNVSGVGEGSSVDLTRTRIPLYHIVDRKIVEDYRSAMSLAIRE